jgi:crotonobetainyl-CoA:carnitine CoA-transferase CaiB-like acyl-CoA transferase
VEDKDFGVMPMHNVLPRLSETPGGFFRPAPEPGADGVAILAEVGLTDVVIARALGQVG